MLQAMFPRDAVRLTALFFWAAVALTTAQPLRAEPGGGDALPDSDVITIVQKGAGSRAAQRAAAAALPVDRLSIIDRRRVSEVVNELSLYRQLPTIRFEAHPETYAFFIAHPDVAVSIWRAMNISKCQMWQTGPNQYEAETDDGTSGVIDVLYRGEGQYLVYSDGLFKSPLLLKPIKARALIHLRSGYFRDDEGKEHITHHADLFVSFPSQTVETAAKLVSPVSNMIVDRNFQEISLFVHMMSLAMSRQPGWVESIAQKLEGILEVRRSQLLKVTARVYVAARKRELANSPLADSITLEDVLEPIRLQAAQEPDVPETSENAKKEEGTTRR